MAKQISCDKATVTNREFNHNSSEMRFIPRIIAFLGYDPCDREADTLGERLVACRQRMGLSQRKFARQLGINPTTVAWWERGDGRPSRKLRERLAVNLGIGPRADTRHE